MKFCNSYHNQLSFAQSSNVHLSLLLITFVFGSVFLCPTQEYSGNVPLRLIVYHCNFFKPPRFFLIDESGTYNSTESIEEDQTESYSNESDDGTITTEVEENSSDTEMNYHAFKKKSFCCCALSSGSHNSSKHNYMF